MITSWPKLRLAPLFALVCGACTQAPRVDASSGSSCTASLAAVGQDGAKSADSAKFAAAFMGMMGTLTMSTIGSSFASAFAFGESGTRPSVNLAPPDSADLSMALCEGLAGLTAAGIVQGADSAIARVNVAVKRRTAVAHLRQLREAKAAADRARDSLRAFQVQSARLLQVAGFVGLEATIVLAVRNGTSHSVSRAYFSARAVSDGRSVPWLEETFNYSIAGGLEPGETARWRLQPNMFQGAWTKVRVPASAKLIVEAIRLDGADGDPLWTGATFTRGDQRLLDSLTRIVE